MMSSMCHSLLILKRSCTRRRTQGFTLIELVMVLVLVGILSAVGIGLFSSPGGYSAGAARDQFVSSANLATKLAQSRSGSADTISLTIEEDASEWRFIVNPGQRTKSASRRNATLSSPLMTLNYETGGRLNPPQNRSFVFSANSDHRACVLASGFAYAGGCP
ncbi:MAG: type II secretion system protein [Halomonadaceae bacterium]|nr:MAG: type II secretion system protein [Halomonadaceae bacterium]